MYKHLPSFYFYKILFLVYNKNIYLAIYFIIPKASASN